MLKGNQVIIRVAIKCDTCDQPHTLRIGLGQEDTQTHTFRCRECSEEITVRMNLDYSRGGAGFDVVENCSSIEEVVGAPIVNLEADFLIPESEQGKDFAFPRMQQFGEIIRKREQSLLAHNHRPRLVRDFGQIKRPDYAGEYKDLKKAWSLARNGHEKLSVRKINEANASRYNREPLDNLSDWVFRLASALTQPSYEPIFLSALKRVKQAQTNEDFKRMVDSFASESKARGEIYFTIMRDFFEAFTEFSQVYFLVSEGIELSSDLTASSTGFEKVKSFYGDCYERFVNVTDYLAFTNNLLLGRKFDQFGALTLPAFKKLDKANRLNPFAADTALIALCAEAEPSIRNASHHGSFSFRVAEQTILYRSGKGGVGPEQQMLYVQYLERSVRIFLQSMCLLKIELMVAANFEKRGPLL